MTEKIYEYKDDHDWYVGSWKGLNTISGLGNESNDEYFFLSRLFEQLNADYSAHWEFENGPSGFAVTIVKKSSDFRIFSFIIDIINDNTERHLEVVEHQGAVLVIEEGRLLYIHLPKGGIELEEFWRKS
ncbi:hypothetical protein [Streptococcus marmotae]|uniref:hypothetical protein n=1 Tax=Streptococcus marmotae TaxID=1825069 RepID=UPI00082F910C|nr:hypothetical protein [Streptococcus marmotae]